VSCAAPTCAEYKKGRKGEKGGKDREQILTTVGLPASAPEASGRSKGEKGEEKGEKKKKKKKRKEEREDTIGLDGSFTVRPRFEWRKIKKGKGKRRSSVS